MEQRFILLCFLIYGVVSLIACGCAFNRECCDKKPRLWVKIVLAVFGTGLAVLIYLLGDVFF